MKFDEMLEVEFVRNARLTLFHLESDLCAFDGRIADSPLYDRCYIIIKTCEV